MASNFHLITVGKLKDQNLKHLEQQFLKRILWGFHLTELKSYQGDIKKEEKEIENKILELNKKNNSIVFLLTENGKHFNSVEFAKEIKEITETGQDIIFIIGGAMGFSKEFKSNDYKKLSLSLLTFPHQITRLILIEQLYRAQTIIQGHPYHH